MNQAGFLHIPDSRYCFATGDHQLTIRLRMAKEDKDLPVYLIYGNKYGFPEKHQEVRLTKRYIDRLHAYYETELDLADSRLAYIFRIEEDGKSFYFSEDGITETYDFSAAYYDFSRCPTSTRPMSTGAWIGPSQLSFTKSLLTASIRGTKKRQGLYQPKLGQEAEQQEFCRR